MAFNCQLKFHDGSNLICLSDGGAGFLDHVDGSLSKRQLLAGNLRCFTFHLMMINSTSC